MITYAEEIKKEHYPYTAKDASTGSYKWSNVQNVALTHRKENSA